MTQPLRQGDAKQHLSVSTLKIKQSVTEGERVTPVSHPHKPPNRWNIPAPGTERKACDLFKRSGKCVWRLFVVLCLQMMVHTPYKELSEQALQTTTSTYLPSKSFVGADDHAGGLTASVWPLLQFALNNTWSHWMFTSHAVHNNLDRGDKLEKKDVIFLVI